MASKGDSREKNGDSTLAPGKTRKPFFSKSTFFSKKEKDAPRNVQEDEEDLGRPERWSMGVLNDPFTHEVPGNAIYSLPLSIESTQHG